MSLDDFKHWGEVHRDLPSKVANASNGPARFSNRGELGVQQFTKGLYALADEGSYFTCSNATPMTAIAGHAASVVADLYTKPYLHIRNDASSSTDTRIYLDFIALQMTVVNTGATATSWAAEMDTGATRRTGAGTALTSVNVAGPESRTSASTIYFGAVTASAATGNARELGAGSLREVIGVVGDIYLWDFGAGLKPQTNMVLAGTTQANITVPMPPVILGPTDQFLLHLFGPSHSGADSYQVRLGYWER